MRQCPCPLLLFNEADSLLPNNTLEIRLLALQIAQLLAMLFCELVARPPDAVLTVVYLGIILLGLSLLGVAMSSSLGRAVVSLWHAIVSFVGSLFSLALYSMLAF